MVFTTDCKEKIISDVLKKLTFNVGHDGYSYIHFILLRAWIEEDDDWTKYGNYLSMIASKNAKTEESIFRQIDAYISFLWHHGNLEILKLIFGYTPKTTNTPSWIFFVRTILSILFYCETNDVDIIALISSLDNPEYKEDKFYTKVLSGYLILLLKQMDFPYTLDDKTEMHIDSIFQSNSFGAAFITYIKHTSSFFSVISFSNIVIPPECYNISIWDLTYDNDRARVAIGNILCKNGISFLKDLRFKSNDEIRQYNGFGATYYDYFIEALKRTTESQKIK